MKIALVGNQNSGKTTLFNLLTGMNSKIGNWPGVTIEKKVGNIKNTNHEIVDLPGIYSLSPYSIEEETSRKFIFEEKVDVIINIVDATSLERSLYLTTQLLELDTRVIIALNMADILEKKGLKINIKNLQDKLGTRVLQISALKETGINELIEEIDKVRNKTKIQIYDTNIEDSIYRIKNLLPIKMQHKRFVTMKLLEDDIRFKNIKSATIAEIINSVKNEYDTDLEEIIAEERYKYITKVKKDTTYQKKMPETMTDVLDKIFLNKWIAFPIFIIIMFLIYYLSVGVIGSYTVNAIGKMIDIFCEIIDTQLYEIGVSDWLSSLIVNGIISGVGAVLKFIPQLAILFFCISLLETTGYMSRISLLLDKVFRRVGLNGKSLIPFIVGSGCSVPGIMGTRIIENEDERKITAILTPFIPCSAKLPIISLFAGYFFPQNIGIASVSLYFFAICIIILSAITMKKLVFKHTFSTYISELPEYKIPSAKYLFQDVSDKVVAFMKRAGTTIVICSIAIWFLLSFSIKMEYGVDVSKSILASIGKKIEWAFYPMLGTNSWEAAVSAIQGLVAKEQVISSLNIISGLAEESSEDREIFSQTGVFGFFTPASAYAFMVFNLFSAPCFGAIAAMKRELGGTKRTLKAIFFQTCLAWLLATGVYQLGSRLEEGVINVIDIILMLGISLAIMSILLCKGEDNSECIRCPYCKTCDKK